MIIREMSSRLEFERIESVAKQSGCDWLLLEYVRGILVPQSRDMEAVELLNHWQEEIQSSFQGKKSISAYEIFLWALTALEYEDSASVSTRSTGGSTSEFFLPSVEKAFEQICDDRVAGVSVASSGMLEFDAKINLGDLRTEFEIQCLWISSLFLLGKRRPRWIFLQQLASASFLQEFFLTTTADSPIHSEEASAFDPEQILALGHYSCVLLPFENAKRVLNSFHDHLSNAGEVSGHQILAFAEAQKRILGKTAPDVIDLIKQLNSQTVKTAQSSITDTRWAIELNRLQQVKEVPLRIARLQRRRQRSVPSTKPDKSAAESIKKAIESTIGNTVDGLDVSIDGENVIVQATVPSYYIRQLVEHKSRSIVVDQLRKKFVSGVVVRN